MALWLGRLFSLFAVAGDVIVVLVVRIGFYPLPDGSHYENSERISPGIKAAKNRASLRETRAVGTSTQSANWLGLLPQNCRQRPARPRQNIEKFAFDFGSHLARI